MKKFALIIVLLVSGSVFADVKDWNNGLCVHYPGFDKFNEHKELLKTHKSSIVILRADYDITSSYIYDKFFQTEELIKAIGSLHCIVVSDVNGESYDYFDVTGMPAIFIYKQDVLSEKFVGSMTFENLEKWILENKP